MPSPTPHNLTGVFEVIAEIEEVGARVGDMIVVRPWADRVAVLQRTIDPQWDFGARCALFYCDPHVGPPSEAIRLLRDTVGGHPHLTLLH